jgi:transcriptional regulator with XRE-family HTH domain
MSKITEGIGIKIKIFRKRNHMTIQSLATAIYKSKATVSKYERGEISIDISTLYDIANALKIEVNQLLYHESLKITNQTSYTVPTFFRNLSQLYCYFYDGRNNQVTVSVIDILCKQADDSYNVRMYMNCKNYDSYQNCENTYDGYMKHYDIMTNLILQHQDTPVELYIINILAPFLDSSYKWAMGKGVSTRPFMPVATKLLITKKRVQITADFEKTLHISKEDIRLLKQYNMFSVTG